MALTAASSETTWWFLAFARVLRPYLPTGVKSLVSRLTLYFLDLDDLTEEY